MNYTCIIPWSGGVESTAVVCDALDKGEVPYLFHLTLNGYWKQQVNAVNKMSEIIGVPVHFVHINYTTPYADYQRTSECYEFGTSPMFINWANTAQLIHFQNPWIPKILYGYNCGIRQRDDGMGDVKTPAVLEVFDSIERAAELSGNPVKMISSLERLCKIEQYDSIWDELKDHVTYCVSPTVNHKPCGECVKCREFQEMCKKD